MIQEIIKSFNPDIYYSDNWCVFDLETTNLSKGSALEEENSIVIAEVRDKKGYKSFAEINETDWYHALKVLDKYDFIIIQNAKFELHWLLRLGHDISKYTVADTMLAEYTLLGNRKQPLDLNSMAKRYGGKGKGSYISNLIHAGICPSQIDRRKLIKYCRQDLDETLFVFRKQVELLQQEKTLPVFFTKNQVVKVLTEMEHKGLYLDNSTVNKLYSEKVQEHNKILEELTKITGGINMNSPKQVGEFIYTTLGIEELKDRRGNPIRTYPGGNKKTDADTIPLLKATTKEQKHFLSLKLEESKLSKMVGTYLGPFKEACENNGCILHGSLNQVIAGTHRLTSSNPNLQNIDRNLKKVVVARTPGWKIRQNDYSKLEFVVAGFLHKDPVILEHVTSGKDVHKTTAAFFTNKPEDQITKEERTKYKPETFSPLYGKVKGNKTQLKYYEYFRNTYKTTTESQDKDIQFVLDNQYITTITGLKFYFPGTTYSPKGFIINSPAIRDYPVQYFATGEIALIGTFLLYYGLKKYKTQSCLINTQHDSTILEECPEESGLVEELSKWCMEDGVKMYLNHIYGIDFTYPLKIDTELKEHW